MVKIERLPSGSYRARVHLGGGKYKSITGKDKKDVQLRAAQLEAGLKFIENTEQKPLTFSEAIDEYIRIKSESLSPSTLVGYRVIQRNYLSSIMDTDIYTLSNIKIQEAVNQMAANGYTAKTIRNAYGLLSKVLKTFRSDFRCSAALPIKYDDEISIPKETDIQKLFEYFYDTPGEVPFALAACCGMRASEIMGLTWDKVDFETSTLFIDAATVRVEHGYATKGAKSRAGKRRIKIIHTVSDILQRHRSDGDGVHVSTITSSGFASRLRTAQAKLGIEHFKVHALRHYAVSVMLSLGIPVKNIAEYVGHADSKMIDRVYGHVMSYKRDEAAAQLESYFENRVFNKSDTKSDTN